MPSIVSACGLHAVEFRIIAACRDGSLRFARRGWTEAKILVQLPAQAVAMTVSSDNAAVTVALMDETLQSFSKKVNLKLVENSFSFTKQTYSLIKHLNVKKALTSLTLHRENCSGQFHYHQQRVQSVRYLFHIRVSHSLLFP